jgi:hypothetical protein
MSTLYRESSIDDSYQVSVHLAKQFRRRFEKIGQSETRIVCGGHFELSLERTFHRCFLLSSFGYEVSEEKIKM